jgi:putative membrane protein
MNAARPSSSSRRAETRTDLAEDRTEYALDRTALANERTCSAWIRTGLTALAAGFGVARFLGETMPEETVRVIASILLACAAAAFTFAAWRYRHLGVRLRRAHVPALPFSAVLLLNLLLAAAALLGLAGLWVR